VSLSWNASAGATQYQVLRAPGTSGGSFQQVGTTGGTSFTNTGLAANSTFRYQVTASNANGTSPPSSTVTATTQGNGTTSPPPPPPAGCQITYQANNWGGSPGFTANVTITNTGSSTISGWTVGWSYSAGQTISPPGWNATVTPSGSSVTATNAAWNGTISPSQSTSFGFNGTATSIGNNPSPTAFTLNGGSCTLG
jgi:mannan endo-1,4-beta-mannosidase